MNLNFCALVVGFTYCVRVKGNPYQPCVVPCNTGANPNDSSSGEDIISKMVGTLLEGASSRIVDEQSTLKAQQTEVNPSPVRKSARLRARFDVTDMSGGSSSECETKEDIKCPSSDSTPTIKPEPIKEETKERSNEIAETEKMDGGVSDGKDTVLSKLKEDVQEESDQGEDIDEGDESEDPDKLYCICRQPHDDRYVLKCADIATIGNYLRSFYFVHRTLA